MMVELDKKPYITNRYRFQWEPAQNCYVLLYQEGVVKLNESAGVILNLCDRNRTVQEIIDELVLEFENENIKDDIVSFLDEAANSKWIDYD